MTAAALQACCSYGSPLNILQTPPLQAGAVQDGVQFQICRLGERADRATVTTVNNIDHILLDGSNGEFRKYLIVSLCGRFKQLVVSQLQYRLHTKFALGKDVQGKTDKLLS